MRLPFLLFFFLLLSFFSFACISTIDKKIDDPGSMSFYEKFSFEKDGRLHFANPLKQITGKKQTSFYAVRFHGEQALEAYYYIRLSDEEKRMSILSPLRIVYKETKKGVQVGAKFGFQVVRSGRFAIKDEIGVIFFLAVPVATTAIGMTGGLAKGVIRAAPKIAQELKKEFYPSDYRMAGWYTFEHDRLKRLHKVKLFTEAGYPLAEYTFLWVGATRQLQDTFVERFAQK